MRNLAPPDNLKWKDIRSAADLPTEEKVFWVRMVAGGITKLQWRNGNWIAWVTFHHPETDPLSIVAAYAPYTPISPKTPEEKREYDRKRRKALKDRQELARQRWIDAGRPKPQKLFKRLMVS